MQDEAKQSALATRLVESLSAESPGFVAVVSGQQCGLCRLPDRTRRGSGRMRTHDDVRPRSCAGLWHGAGDLSAKRNRVALTQGRGRSHLRTASALGIKLPRTLMLQATRVIE